MRARVALLAVALLATGVGGASGAGTGTASLGPTGDHGTFLNVLPAGQGSNVTPAQAAAWFATGQMPPHSDDQLEMYSSLPAADLAALSDADLSTYFKSESFVLPDAEIASTVSPRPGLVIARDTFGVPHIYGQTRADAAFGAGYATASDRLFMIDVLRHVGRGRVSELLGASDENLGLDRDTYLVAGYSEEEFQQQVDRADLFGELGQQVRADGEAYIAGINARIAELRLRPDELPAEYGALQIAPEDWKLTDIVAVAVLIQATFAGGGGGELRNALFLQEAAAKHGTAKARALWRDLDSAEDPEAPVTTTASFPYMTPAPVDPAAVAIPDPGSVVAFDPISTQPSSGGSASAPSPTGPLALDPVAALKDGLARIGLDFPGAMSNWLAVTARKAKGGHPIAVMGPQTGYFSPEILMEMDIHAPGFDARGAAFPGISLYVLLGRGPDYAWSATSGSSDMIDVRAERLCDPGGGQPAADATHYLFEGECVPMTVREDQWFAKPSAGGPAPPTVVTARVERTVHGPVFARGTVSGDPVAFVQQRSTFFAELDSAGAFTLMNGSGVTDAASFKEAMNLVTGSFNWLYVDDRDVAFFHSGLYPERAVGVDPELPSWGTGEWEWTGFVPMAEHPQAVNPSTGYIASWNNKPARAWRAADANWGFGPIHRSEMLSDRLAARVPAGGVGISEMVAIMADAATVDLRGQETLPVVLQAIGKPPADLAQAVGLLKAWVASGAHRLDRDGDGEYEHQAAVALMDAWWERLIRAAFDPYLDGLYDDAAVGFDDGNRAAGLGSAFQSGYFGYLERTVRMAMGQKVKGPYSVLRCANGTKAGCRAAIVDSLRATVAALGGDPSSWAAGEAGETIRFTTVGLVEIPPIPWQNRPTFQQVVQVTSHRPRV